MLQASGRSGHAGISEVTTGFPAALVLTLAWGVLAFGAVYVWAYVPLLIAAAAIGAWGVIAPTPTRTRRVSRPVVVGILLLGAATVVQLIPLPRETLVAISPGADVFLQGYEVRYAALLAAGAPVSHALSIDPSRTRLGLTFVAALGLLLAGLTRILDGHILRRLLPAMVVLGTAVGAIGIIQRPLFAGRIYGFWTPEAGPMLFGSGGGPFGPFVNRNHFAGWMLMMAPLAAGYFSALVSRGQGGVRPGWRARLIWFSSPHANFAILAAFAVVLMALSLVLTLSRSGTTCLVGALVLMLPVVVRRHRAWSQRGVVALVLIASAMIVTRLTGPDAIGARFDQVDLGLAGRMGAWRDAWRVVEAFPWTGTGLNTYGIAMLSFQSFLTDRFHFAEAHSDYLQLLAEGGLLLSTAVVVAAGVFAREVHRRFRDGGDDEFGYWIRVGAVTGLVAVALQELVEFSLQMPGNAALFVVLCAIAVREPSASRTLAAEGKDALAR